ncbi:MAG: glycosyltransferase family 2 protein [Luteibaculum sp.]
MPHRNSPLVSIITVNYDGLEDTLDLIRSVEKVNYPTWELWVVDNGSELDPGESIKSLFPDVHVIRSEENLGFAGGNNLAVHQAKGDYLFFVNNDSILHPDCLQILVETAESLPNLGAISPKFHYYHHSNLIEFAGCSQVNLLTARNHAVLNKKQDDGITGLIETSYVHGAGMLVPKRVIQLVGTMDASFFLYYEELDWCERIRRAGFNIYCQRNALMFHKESATVGKQSPLKTYYLNRNRILFMRRNFPFPKNLPFIVYLLLISIPSNLLRFILKGEREHLRAYLKGVYWHINPKVSL